MATISHFEELEIWKAARELCIQVHSYTRQEAFSKDYKLISQLNGSSGSVMDNIAEGFERGSKLEFFQFLGFAKGSVAESKSQLYRALDRSYISKNEFDSSYNLADKITKGIQSFISYLNKTEFKGEKFKNRVIPTLEK